MFKKSRLKNYSTGMNESGGKKLYSPTFAKRKTDNKPSNSQVKSYSLNKQAQGNEASKREQGNLSQLWHKDLPSGVITWAEDEDYLLFGTTGSLDDAQAPFNHNMFETNFNDQRAEDEVHPDFH
ncbi:hypothetical protein IFM89_001018 [Coptis chinensis]|uniref:Uncharacterized protein n=1 Tax=Coptis chinensis TaxID=261450 RepID=A0A835GU03_9MAGN|nr:hypothetical protein IFM89_001018 [Coptis chinensis]